MRYITIEREYGSGATKIAQKLSQETGIKCYGAEILEEAASRMNLTANEISDYEEKATNSLLYSIYLLSKMSSASDTRLAKEGMVYVEEQNVIKEFADKGDAVFIGHCASNALQDYRNVVRVYIHADEEFKRKRIKEDYGIKDNLIDSMERKINRRRANYFNVNTQKKWSDLSNYDIVLDSGRLGIDKCVDILRAVLKK